MKLTKESAIRIMDDVWYNHDEIYDSRDGTFSTSGFVEYLIKLNFTFKKNDPSQSELEVEIKEK